MVCGTLERKLVLHKQFVNQVMKKSILALMCILTLASCDCGTCDSLDTNSTSNTKLDVVFMNDKHEMRRKPDDRWLTSVEHIEIDGHRYILFREHLGGSNISHGGLVHDPKCKCHTSLTSTTNDYDF